VTRARWCDCEMWLCTQLASNARQGSRRCDAARRKQTDLRVCTATQQQGPHGRPACWRRSRREDARLAQLSRSAAAVAVASADAEPERRAAIMHRRRRRGKRRRANLGHAPPPASSVPRTTTSRAPCPSPVLPHHRASQRRLIRHRIAAALRSVTPSAAGAPARAALRTRALHLRVLCACRRLPVPCVVRDDLGPPSVLLAQ
jgi:hypothetical protein